MGTNLLNSLAGPLVSGVSSLLGGAFSQGNTASNIQQQENFQASQTQQQEQFQTQAVQNQEAYNSSQVQQQENFQEQMSNTAYQRATSSMEGAGLNPVLAYAQGGASTPMGSSASASAPSGSAQSGASFASNQAPNLLGNSVSSAMDTAQQMAQIANTNANTKSTLATAGLTDTNRQIKNPEADLMNDLDAFLKGFLPKANSAQSAGSTVNNVISQLGQEYPPGFGNTMLENWWNSQFDGNSNAGS